MQTSVIGFPRIGTLRELNELSGLVESNDYNEDSVYKKMNYYLASAEIVETKK